MEQKYVRVLVRERIAQLEDPTATIICGNPDFRIVFDFDSEWDPHVQKTATFVTENDAIDVKFSGTICPVPELSNVTHVHVGVYVGDLATTTDATILCRKSIKCLSGDGVKEIDFAKLLDDINTAEEGRVANENQRVENELLREQAEEERSEAFEEMMNGSKDSIAALGQQVAAVGKLAEANSKSVEELTQQINVVDETLAAAVEDVEMIDRRVENVEAALLGDVYASAAMTSNGSHFKIDSDVLPWSKLLYLHGNSEKTSKNVLPNDYLSLAGGKTSAYINGITYTLLPDGRIHAKGRASVRSEFWIANFDNSRLTPGAGTWTASGCPAGGDQHTYSIRMIVVDPDKVSKATKYETGQGQTVELVSTDVVTFIIRVEEGCTVDKVFSPMLEKGSKKTGYQPYGRKTFMHAPVKAIKSYTAAGVLVDEFEIPEEIRNLPGYGLGSVSQGQIRYYYTISGRQYTSHTSTLRNMLRFTDKTYTQYVAVKPYAGNEQYTVNDGVQTLYGILETVTDVSQWLPEDGVYLKLSPGGYIELECEDYGDSTFSYQYQYKVGT